MYPQENLGTPSLRHMELPIDFERVFIYGLPDLSFFVQYARWRFVTLEVYLMLFNHAAIKLCLMLSSLACSEVEKKSKGEMITHENFMKITIGMDRAEVIRILNCEPGYYTNKIIVYHQIVGVTAASYFPENWISDSCSINLGFGPDNKVVRKMYLE